MRCVADHRLQVEAILQVRQRSWSLSTTVISLFSDARLSATLAPDLASAENDDTHGCP
jgi:hypothetical protein